MAIKLANAALYEVANEVGKHIIITNVQADEHGTFTVEYAEVMHCPLETDTDAD